MTSGALLDTELSSFPERWLIISTSHVLITRCCNKYPIEDCYFHFSGICAARYIAEGRKMFESALWPYILEATTRLTEGLKTDRVNQ